MEKEMHSEIRETSLIPETWVKKGGSGLSVMELQDFGRLLMGSAEHRKGAVALHQVSMEKPLEVHFFADDPGAVDAIYHITSDFKTRSFKITRVQGESGKLKAWLEEFGFEPISATEK